jgi:hypothetical protein
MKTTRFVVFLAAMAASTSAFAANFDGTLDADDRHIIGVLDSNIVLCNVTDSTVEHTFQSGDTLSGATSALLGDNDNVLEVIIANEAACGDTMSPINFGGTTLTIDGEGGADVLTGGNGGGTILLGNSGGDDLTVRNAAGYADGGADRDRVRSNMTGGSEDLFGGDANDCLEQIQKGTAPDNFLCEAGTGDRYNPPTGGADASCETSIVNDSCIYPVTY